LGPWVVVSGWFVSVWFVCPTELTFRYSSDRLSATNMSHVMAFEQNELPSRR